MGLFDDFNQFLEARLEEFLREHPELELQAIEEQLREQEADARRTLVDLKGQESRLQAQILETAQDIQRWHVRIQKVEAAGELKLAAAAREREAALLRQGNQLWGQMAGVKARSQQIETLLGQIAARRQEVKAKAAAQRAQAAKAAQQSPTPPPSWTPTPPPRSPYDPLEDQFRRWETDSELEELKRRMGKG
ncbi:MAG: TIGR04376 family protein [Cyanophyceae cyanobacterium]